MSSLPKVLAIAGMLLLLVIAYVAHSYFDDDAGEYDESQAVVVYIPAGSSFSAIVDSLVASGLLTDVAAFRFMATATGVDDELQSGTYTFMPGISQKNLLKSLRDGSAISRRKVTFPEGITIRAVASIAQEKAGIDSARFVRLANDREHLASIGLNASTAEGYLMPETYFIDKGSSAEQVLAMMVDQFKSFYDDRMKAAARENGLTPYETIILASLVEGEARVSEERDVIAGLYLNRLRKGMRLEADPTIQYILPDGPRRLLYRDLEIDSPYNTYRRKGLPPTPINNPGRAAIEAAVDPAEHDYLFMVARGDGTGEHVFNVNAAQHRRAVREYRRSKEAAELMN